MSKEMLKKATSILPGQVITEEDKKIIEFDKYFSKLKKYVKNPKNKQSKNFEKKYKIFRELFKKVGGLA